MLAGRHRILHAAEVAGQPFPEYISLNYADLFKIQRVSNPFPLRPVSFSRLSAYLECPACTLEQRRKKRPKEPGQFTNIHQGSLFGSREPDPRLIGTLLHAIVDLLHDSQGPLSAEQQALLLTYPDVLTSFIRHELLSALQQAGKVRLAMLMDELCSYEETLYPLIIRPLLGYQRELLRGGATIFAASERFQLKLLSTGKTFVGHSDWGGTVALVGEFDQIRLRSCSEGEVRPAIIEFKKGLGKKRSLDRWGAVLEGETGEREAAGSDELVEPGMAHAWQLMIYWLAFQTRWDLMERVKLARGRVEDLSMSVAQPLDLILYNLHDSCQYQLVPTDFQESLLCVTNCIFYLNWAMKSGYAWQSPEHDCGKTHLLSDVPRPQIQVGTESISAAQCYALAKESFQGFSRTVRWRKI